MRDRQGQPQKADAASLAEQFPFEGVDASGPDDGDDAAIDGGVGCEFCSAEQRCVADACEVIGSGITGGGDGTAVGTHNDDPRSEGSKDRSGVDGSNNLVIYFLVTGILVAIVTIYIVNLRKR